MSSSIGSWLSLESPSAFCCATRSLKRGSHRRLGKPLADALLQTSEELGTLLTREHVCARLGLLEVGNFIQISTANSEEDVNGGRAESYQVYERKASAGAAEPSEWDVDLIREFDNDDEDVVLTRHRTDGRVEEALTRLLGKLDLHEGLHFGWRALPNGERASEEDEAILLREMHAQKRRRNSNVRDASGARILEAFALLLEKAVGSRAATELILDLSIDIRCFALRERAHLLAAVENGTSSTHFRGDLGADLAASLTGVGNAMLKSGRPTAALAAYQAAHRVKSSRTSVPALFVTPLVSPQVGEYAERVATWPSRVALSRPSLLQGSNMTCILLRL